VGLDSKHAYLLKPWLHNGERLVRRTLSVRSHAEVCSLPETYVAPVVDLSPPALLCLLTVLGGEKSAFRLASLNVANGAVTEFDISLPLGPGHRVSASGQSMLSVVTSSREPPLVLCGDARRGDVIVLVGDTLYKVPPKEETSIQWTSFGWRPNGGTPPGSTD